MPLVTNRRGRRTRRALREALAEEIRETGDLTQVTVTSVTERADVTRRTFYSHYRDIPDLVRSIEDEAIEELRPLVRRIGETDLEQLDRALAAFAPCPGSTELLSYFAERPYLAALLGEGGDPAFPHRLELMVRDEVQEHAAQGFAPDGPEALFDYYLTYAISAEVGVLVRWLSSGAHEPVAVMARVMTALMFVRPGDLYGKPIGFDIPTVATVLAAQRKEVLNG